MAALRRTTTALVLTGSCLVCASGISPCAGPTREAEAAPPPTPPALVAPAEPPPPLPVAAPPAAPAPSTPAVQAPSAGARLEDEQNTIDIFQAAAPATVFVTQKRVVRDLNMRALEVPAGSGTGFIWDRAGHIVTNYHVIDTGRARGSYAVTLFNHKTYDAVLVGGEPKRDIAVLKIDAPADELTPIRVLDADGRIDVGQKTIAIGNPFGLDHTLTTGVVSAMGREVVGYGGITIRDMIQTDASINPGNSGGPLLDSRGRLIGMNTMIFSKTGSSAGIGFAVPVTTIRRIVPQLISTGKVEQIGLGITFLDESIAARAGIKGVIITGVAAGSPAARAGLVPLRQTRDGGILMGDVLVGIDALSIDNYDDLYNALERYKDGDEVRVRVVRDGAVVSLPLTLAVID
ncbi:MAG: trypsin-like peptidase domain-containing protein [Myxococcales bacterium]|nr:trypsin-like peptidase domain-containing protein [Myxococcales bacterium]